jgi:hypothetical protein
MCLDLPGEDMDRVLWRNAADVLGERLPAAWGQPGPAVSPVSRSAPTPVVLNVRPESGWTPLIDVNSFLGEWPSRRLHGSPPPSPAGLLDRRIEQMERSGIDFALVSPLDAVLLKDVDVANRELHDLLVAHPAASEYVRPAYVLNPTWPAWEEHLEQCLGDYRLSPAGGAIRLVPGYHGYRLDDESLASFFARVAARALPVIVTVQLEDSRMHHPAMRVPDVSLDQIAARIGRHRKSCILRPSFAPSFRQVRRERAGPQPASKSR